MESIQPTSSLYTTLEGRYELQSSIGRGGFGQVYKARRLATEQEVAIKVLRPPPDPDERLRQKHLARFRREMRICARLFHPHIVRPIDSGSTPDGLLFSVFEFVPGDTLAGLLEHEGSLEPREAIRLMLQVLDALACAHRSGVVHRDIKPHNIMISDTGSRRNALVLDFGLSTVCEEFRAGDDSRLSSDFEVVGTPAYAAPEQLMGQHADMRSDIYSWGLVFLECLMGEPVMKARSLKEVLRKQLGSEPIPIPEALEGLRLGELLRHATEKDIEKRDVTTEDLVRELELCELEEGHVVTRRFAMAHAQPGSIPRKAPRSGTSWSEGECRQLTVLCCGVTVTQSRSGQMEFEELDGILRAHQQQCIELVERLGGYVGSVLADRMLFYFGYPTAREDSPRGAARSAMKILDAALHRGAELEPAFGLRMEARAGIHTGIVVIQEARNEAQQNFPAIQGATPMIATRLQELAEPGEVLISQDAQRLLRNHFVLESVGERRIDPLSSRATEVFRLTLALGTELARLPDAPMVGRVQELELLLRRWSMVQQGVGQALFITGEPGIGKTRLVQELRLELRGTPHTLLECRCTPEERNSPLRPIIDMLERLLGRGDDWSVEKTRSELETLLARYGFDVSEMMPLYEALLSLPPGDRYPPLQVLPEWQRALTFESLLELLVEMATQHPVLLIIEDLHWADPTTLELLRFLLDAVSSARLCILSTARSDFILEWTPSQVFQLHLGRLDHHQVGELVAGITRGKALPEDVLRGVVSRTDGVPLFVEELTRMVLESGALAEEGGHYRLVGSLSDLAIPGTLRGLLEAKLDRLGRSKETAAIAAALGREFGQELLLSVSPRDERSLQADLSSLVSADLLQHRYRRRHPSYAFKHALIRDAAYESIPKHARRELHVRIAAVLSERFPQVVETQPELLAHHYTEAALTQPAIKYWLEAGKRALSRSANLEAIEHLSHALRLLATLPESRDRDLQELEVQTALGPALIAVKTYAAPEVEQAYARANELCMRVGQTPQLFLVLWGLFSYYLVRGRLETALELGQQMLRLGELLSDAAIIEGAHVSLGTVLFYRGEFATAWVHLEQGLALDSTERERAQTLLTGQDIGMVGRLYAGLVLWSLGYPDQARRQSQDAIAIARGIDHPFSLAFALHFHCMLLQFCRDRAAARGWIDEEIALSEKHAYIWWLLWGRLQRGWLLIVEPDRVEEADGLMRRNLEAIVSSGFLIGLTHVLALEADSYLECGRLGDVRRTLDLAFEAGSRLEAHFKSELYRLEGEWMLAVGAESAGTVEDRFLRALEVARGQRALAMELRAAMSLCRLWRSQGRSADAHGLLGEVYGRFTEGFETPDLRDAQALLATLRPGDEAANPRELFH